MTRELTAHHNPATMTPNFAAALAVHRAHPGLSVVELCQRAKLPGGVRRAIEHALDCPTCVVGAFCPKGARLAANIRRPRLALRSAAVAQARARKPEGTG